MDEQKLAEYLKWRLRDLDSQIDEAAHNGYRIIPAYNARDEIYRLVIQFDLPVKLKDTERADGIRRRVEELEKKKQRRQRKT